METKKKSLILLFLALSIYSFSQGFQITPLKLEFDGKQLQITYDFVNKSASDEFYVWVEMEKKNGQPLRVKALSGDIGKTKSGKDKKITWIPDKDSIFLDEEVLVEVKAEKYIKSFNKGSMMLLSTVVPGLGQSKISKGKPYWLAGVAAYGALAGGLVVNQSYVKSYDLYRTEEDPTKRRDLLDQAQSQKNLSGVLIVSGAAIWAANLFWVAAIPNKYQPLKHVNLSLDQSRGPIQGATLLSLKVNF
ncbi:MAG: hypothetical protein IPJ16_13180 [Bacteroidales bacterium]|nr:hypothetical protein [Bacteroidales bacterium]